MATADWISIHLPSGRQMGRFLAWGTGRLIFSGVLFLLDASTHTLQTIMTLTKWTRQSLTNLVRLYDQLPYAGVYGQNIIEAKATVVSESPDEIIADIIEAIKGKQLMLIGEMGTGKSTLAQYLAYSVGGNVKVYECEGTPDDWQGLEVFGKGERWDEIEEGMKGDLEDLSNKIQLRLNKGDNALVGTDKVIIVEEYPEVAGKVSTASEWLERHARRGRKAKQFLILLSQYDNVSAWGLEGKFALSQAFSRLRLGKVAVTHAKSLKREDLIKWLQQDKSHCLLDDKPCKLPPYRELKAVTHRLSFAPSPTPLVTTQLTTSSDFYPKNIPDNLGTEALNRAIKACLDAGLSDSKIIKEVLGYQGSQYHAGKFLLEQIKVKV